jgi:hypothetical protein
MVSMLNETDLRIGVLSSLHPIGAFFMTFHSKEPENRVCAFQSGCLVMNCGLQSSAVFEEDSGFRRHHRQLSKPDGTNRRGTQRNAEGFSIGVVLPDTKTRNLSM